MTINYSDEQSQYVSDSEYNYGTVFVPVSGGPDFTLFSIVDRDAWVYSPTYIRTRHRYRGARESAKLNLEVYSFNYDVRRINKQLTKSNDDLLLYMNIIQNGGTVDLGDSYLAVEGLDRLSAHVENVKRRIRSLEYGD